MKPEWEKAARSGDVESLRQMLHDAAVSGPASSSASSPINALDKHGQTALMLAATRGHTAAVRLLIEQGADLNHTAKYGLSALMLAVINNHAEIVRLLAAAGANRQIRGSGAPGFHQKTALDLAAGAGREELSSILRSTAKGDWPTENR